MSKTLNRVRCGGTLGAKYAWEIAEDLGISESQVGNLIRSGELTARKIGKRRYIIMPEDLQAYLEKSRTDNETEEGEEDGE